MNSLSETLQYLVQEANNFDMGAAWGVSSYADIIFETVCRVYEKQTGKPYPHQFNRIYKSLEIKSFLETAKKENKEYLDMHPKTANMMKKMFIILERE